MFRIILQYTLLLRKKEREKEKEGKALLTYTLLILQKQLKQKKANIPSPVQNLLESSTTYCTESKGFLSPSGGNLFKWN